MLSITGGTATSTALVSKNVKAKSDEISVRSLLPSKANLLIKPTWHAPWKLYRVISGHTGWVRSVDVEPHNEWFATGGSDRIIKVHF
jgi:pleiotropic regulator 1